MLPASLQNAVLCIDTPPNFEYLGGASCAASPPAVPATVRHAACLANAHRSPTVGVWRLSEGR